MIFVQAWTILGCMKRTTVPALTKYETGMISEMAHAMDLIMVLDMEKMSRYREIYGEEYTFVACVEYDGTMAAPAYVPVRGGVDDTGVM